MQVIVSSGDGDDYTQPETNPYTVHRPEPARHAALQDQRASSRREVPRGVDELGFGSRRRPDPSHPVRGAGLKYISALRVLCGDPWPSPSSALTACGLFQSPQRSSFGSHTVFYPLIPLRPAPHSQLPKPGGDQGRSPSDLAARQPIALSDRHKALPVQVSQCA